MKIAVTDACIFIELLESEACDPFFRLPVEIVTTVQVWRELDGDQHDILNRWIESDDLKITSFYSDPFEIQSEHNISESLSVADLSVWGLCHENGDLLLTSDGTLRKMAKKHKMETHGILWIFDQLVENQLLPVSDAVDKLQGIFTRNIIYRTDSKLIEAFEVLKSEWEK